LVSGEDCGSAAAIGTPSPGLLDLSDDCGCVLTRGNGALAAAGNAENVSHDPRAAQMDVSLGYGVKEHGGSELDGLSVFERREVELVLARIGAGDLHRILAGTGDGFGTALVPVVDDLLRGEWRRMVLMQARVEIAERRSGERWRLAAQAIGF